MVLELTDQLLSKTSSEMKRSQLFIVQNAVNARNNTLGKLHKENHTILRTQVGQDQQIAECNCWTL